MTQSDWLMVIAVLLSPLLALQVQHYIDYFRERKRRKIRIFEALMTTRHDRISQYHVQALNMIDIDFYGFKFLGIRIRTRKEKEVVTSWKIYLDNLNMPGELEGAQLDNWINKNNELFTDLLYKMSIDLGYDFDRVHLNRSIYTPRAHGNQILENESIRQNILKILEGSKPLPMKLVVDEETQKNQKEILKKYDEVLGGLRSLKVEISESKKPDLKDE